MTVLSKEKAVDLLTMKSTLKYQDQIQTEGMLLAVLKKNFFETNDKPLLVDRHKIKNRIFAYFYNLHLGNGVT